ncbi:MAG: histidine phosphatase family protein [Elusimicrobiota bacterium]
MLKRTLFLLAVCAALALAAASAQAAPAQVILIRHAEKPAYGAGLSAQGFQRAQALVGFFRSYEAPAAVYAMAPKHEDSSVRAIQTVTPLAQALGLTLNTEFTRGQKHKLVNAIMAAPEYEGRLVLVCWEHDALVDIAEEFAVYGGPGQQAQPAIPSYWAASVFDRAWVLNFAGGKLISFEDIPQRLLPGDSAR